MRLFDLTGKVAVVTGASRGLGRGMALGLAEAGANLVLVSRSSSAETASLVRQQGVRCISIEADLELRDAIPGIIEETLDDFGQLDILVNNAGTIRRAPVLEYSEEDWDAVIQVNQTAPFLLAQAAGRVMKEQGGGKIINIASVLSYQGGILVAPYTASKSALMGLTRLMANELAPLGINVNAIAPGYMATDNTQALQDDEARNKAILERIPAGRWGTPDDLKGAVVFLASTASNYMHGFTMAVDGGWLAR